MPLSHSIDAPPERDSCASAVSGRWSRSQHRAPLIEEHHQSPLRQKLRKRSAGTYRSTGRLHQRESEKVHGNRHVGGACGHTHDKKPRPPHQRSTSPSGCKKKKKYVVLSPSRKHERMTAEREEEFTNYRNLVE